MIRRVFTNQHDMIVLDSNMFGARKRLSTGKKADKRLMSWYTKNFEQEYIKLYESTYGKSTATGTVTFREYGEIVIAATSENRSELSQQDLNSLFSKLCETFGEYPLEDIKKLDCQRWQNTMLKTYAPKTVRNYRWPLSMILDFAVDDDIIPKNPLARVPTPKVRRKRNLTSMEKKVKPVYYSIEDMARIIHAATGQEKNVYQIACFSGLRGSELIGLKWESVNFEEKTILVENRIRRGTEGGTKNGEDRLIDMFTQAEQALRSQQKKTGLGTYVFLNQYGQPYKCHQVFTRQLKKLTTELGLETGGMHDLRRSFNTMLKQVGYPLDYVLQVMGHKTDDVNTNHYTGRITADISIVNSIAM